MKGSDNPFPSVLMAEQASAPAAPPAGDQRLFLDSATHLPKLVNSAGTVISFGGTSTLAADTDVGITSPVAGQHLYYDGTHWVNVGPSKTQLTYNASTDLANGAALTANTWTDLGTNQSFTVDDANSIIEISVGGQVLVGFNASLQNGAARIVLDSAGTPTNIVIGGCRCPVNEAGNVLSGSAVRLPSGLSAGTHTIKLQVLCTGAGSVYCLAATQPNVAQLYFNVVEVKR